MKEKRLILSIAKKQLEKELSKEQKNVAKHSQKLANVDMNEITLKGRAKLRMNLDAACESRDIVQCRLDYLKEWILEVNQ